MRVSVLGSGSTGNSVMISTEKTRVLVDAGMSAKQILERIAAIGEDPARIDAILITHEHSDHAGGLRVLMKSVNCPVFISEATEDAYFGTRRGFREGESEAVKRRDALKNKTVAIESNREFRIGDIDFEPFTVPHDAADNFGFVARKDGVRIATLMDFGHMTELIKEKLRNCDCIVVESNHSRDMLRACSVYSWDLKQRILSRTGHLSNEDLSDWLTNDFDGSARDIVLAHLSQRANEPNLARITAESALKMRPEFFKTDSRITISGYREPTAWLDY